MRNTLDRLAMGRSLQDTYNSIDEAQLQKHTFDRYFVLKILSKMNSPEMSSKTRAWRLFMFDQLHYTIAHYLLRAAKAKLRAPEAFAK